MALRGTMNADGTITIEGETYNIHRTGDRIILHTSSAMQERIKQLEWYFENRRGVPNRMRTELLILQREMPILREKERLASRMAQASMRVIK